MKKEVVSIYVDNKANVLTRVVSLYGRRGFNIDSPDSLGYQRSRHFPDNHYL